MSWATFRAKVVEVNEDLLLQGIEPSNPEIVWTTKVVCSEDVVEFEEISPARVLLLMYSGYKLIVQGKIEEITKILQEMDYPEPEQELETENAIQ